MLIYRCICLCTSSFFSLANSDSGTSVSILIDSIELDFVDGPEEYELILASNAVSVPVVNTKHYLIDLAPATGNITIDLISNLYSNEVASIKITTLQDSTNRTATWLANSGTGSVVWAGGSAPTLSTGSGARDEWMFYTSDGGTTWVGQQIAADVS